MRTLGKAQLPGLCRLALPLLAVAAFASLSPAGEPGVPKWRKLYVGEEAAKDVIALWQFQPGAELKDSSGNGHDLKLRGTAQFTKEGRFGSCLRPIKGAPIKEKAGGATTANHPALSPRGAFTIEMWIKPGPELAGVKQAFLLDKKYVGYKSNHARHNSDYQLIMRKAGKDWQLHANLGYGKDSATYKSKAVSYQEGEWYHVAFTYDGKGTVCFFRNGMPLGKTTHLGRGAVSPGRYSVIIGDRVGSNYVAFPGYIDQVRISRGVREFFAAKPRLIRASERMAFVRSGKERQPHAARRERYGLASDQGCCHGSAKPKSGEKVFAAKSGEPEKPGLYYSC